MPIYEYYCIECDNLIEEILPVGEHKIECKKCGKIMERMMSQFLGIVPGSENRLLDCVIGKNAETRWKQIHKRKEIRDKLRKPKENKDAG